MIKLFRNIRKKLISENRSIIRNTNYFKYAIGEILLVVIGILIALQVNNWNEIRKINKQQLELLKSIHNEFVFNREELNRSINKAQIIQRNCEELLKKYRQP